MFVFVILLPVSPELFEAEVKRWGSHGSVMVHLVRGSYCGKTGGGGALHGSFPFLLLFLCGSAFVSLIMLIPA